jgi:hypothetical protein
MTNGLTNPIGAATLRPRLGALLAVVIAWMPLAPAWAADPPVPLLAAGRQVNWWFVFKLNAKEFPGCGAAVEQRACAFDGGRLPPKFSEGYGQQFVYASSADSTLKQGSGCAGETATDPLGATFGNIYNGDFNYLVWNDQPKGHPSIAGCTQDGNCNAPWGHSKGLLAWGDDGQGVFLQVTTPSWPLSASRRAPRVGDANTLGCVADDDVKLSQHFFAIKLTKDDLVSVLKALHNASIGTDPQQAQLVRNGGPADVKALVSQLGKRSNSKTATRVTLSSGVGLISKPSDLNVPPWQLVSALLGGVSLRAATFWDAPKLPSTSASTSIACWDPSLPAPGPVEIALTGRWGGTTLNLGSGGNHAKIGVSTDPAKPFVIFGDENQQGALEGHCGASQNGRGGVFFTLSDPVLAKGLRSLLEGTSSPLAPLAAGAR